MSYHPNSLRGSEVVSIRRSGDPDNEAFNRPTGTVVTYGTRPVGVAVSRTPTSPTPWYQPSRIKDQREKPSWFDWIQNAVVNKAAAETMAAQNAQNQIEEASTRKKLVTVGILAVGGVVAYGIYRRRKKGTP